MGRNNSRTAYWGNGGFWLEGMMPILKRKAWIFKQEDIEIQFDFRDRKQGSYGGEGNN